MALRALHLDRFAGKYLCSRGAPGSAYRRSQKVLLRIIVRPGGVKGERSGTSQLRDTDTIRIELHQPLDTPAVVMVVWPAKPSVTAATPKH